MGFFSPRLSRMESDYRVGVRLQDDNSGELLPGSCFGVITSISQGGACLVLSKMMLEGKHLFFSTLNNERYHLVLLVENPKLRDEIIQVPARSVWMDSCRYKDESAFKIGLCFHEKQKKLFQLFKR